MPIVPVILSGGSGSRLWPVSRLDRPKQLIPGLVANENNYSLQLKWKIIRNTISVLILDEKEKITNRLEK